MAWLCVSHLLSISFLFSWSLQICFGRNASTDSTFDFQLADTCNDPGSSSGWWLPLQRADSRLRDPCQIHQDMKDKDGFTACCLGDELNVIGAENCGPCTLEMYNIAAACLACSNDARSVNAVPDIGSETRYIHEIERGGGHGPSDNTVFPRRLEFNKGTRNVSLDGFALPPWLNASLKDGYFDPSAAVTMAQQVFTISSSSVAAPSKSSSSTSTSSESTRLPSAFPSSTASFHKQVSVIAGGTIGGAILVGITIFLVVVFIRKRRPTKCMITEQTFAGSRSEVWRLTNPEPYMIGTREEMQESVGIVGNTHGKPRPLSVANVQHLTRTTQLGNTGHVSNLLAQRERREMDAGRVSMDIDEAESEARTLPPNYSDVFQGSNAQA